MGMVMQWPWQRKKKGVHELTGLDPREQARALQEFDETARRFQAERRQLVVKYADKWIAYSRGKVIGVANSRDELQATILSKVAKTDPLIVEHLRSEPEIRVY